MQDRKGVLLVGSITQDYVDTPGAKVEAELGGSATYAALAARYFGPVSVVGAVGRDRAEEFMRLLHFADLTRLRPFDGTTYTWRARRESTGGDATTLERFTGVSDGYRPDLSQPDPPPAAVLLGSCDPEAQLAAIQSCPPGALVGFDTMDIFIEGQRTAVERVARSCHVLFLTARELQLLTGTRGVGAGALRVLDQYPLNALVVKLGPDGAALWTHHDDRQLPACPVEVVDPTGAGDALAGAFLGRVSEIGPPHDETALLDALEWGIVASSFAISAVGVAGLQAATRADLEARLDVYRADQGAAAPA